MKFDKVRGSILKKGSPDRVPARSCLSAFGLCTRGEGQWPSYFTFHCHRAACVRGYEGYTCVVRRVDLNQSEKHCSLSSRAMCRCSAPVLSAMEVQRRQLELRNLLVVLSSVNP